VGKSNDRARGGRVAPSGSAAPSGPASRAAGVAPSGRSGEPTADRAPARLQRLPSWLLNQAALHASRFAGEAFARAGVRRYHFSVLVALAEDGPASQADLGRRLWIDRSDMVAVINDLERDGLVARVRDEQDRRRNLVRLTPVGKRALDRLETQVEDAQAALLEPLSGPERRELLRLLTRLVEAHGEQPKH
jgi:MarR family transcriptional regulator, lower aerobic nicotinate degradation pathway regulator